MRTLTIQLPDGVLGALQSCAAKEGVTVDQSIASAAAEKVSALASAEGLRHRAQGASKKTKAAKGGRRELTVDSFNHTFVWYYQSWPN